MAAKLETRYLPDRLEWRVTERHTRTYMLLLTAAWMLGLCIPVGMAADSPFFAIGTAGVLIYGAIVSVTRARRGTDVTFTVTERDIVSYGYTQDEYSPVNRWRRRAPDLAWRERRQEGENGPVFPKGVYSGRDCVLPLVAMEDGHRIVEAVYRRFPDTASDSEYDRSSVPSSLITLGLSKR